MNRCGIWRARVCCFLLLVLITVAALSGCTRQEAAATNEQIVVTDLAGRQVRLRTPVNKVILQWSGSGGGFITLMALEGKNVHRKIAGWDFGLKNYRYDMWGKFSGAMPELEQIPDVGNIDQNTFNVEKVIALKPDVLILPLSLSKQAQDIVNKLEAAGIPTVFIDYHLQTLENHTKSILLLGKIFGKEERARQIATHYQEQVQTVYSRLAAIKQPKPTVYIEVGSEGPAAYGNTYGKYMWGALVEQCGGINIARDKVEKWAPVNPEFLLKANPDIIIITGSYWPKKSESMRLGYLANPAESQKLLRDFIRRPGWEELNAVKNNRVFAVHHGIARNIYDFVVIQYLAKVFYPDEFKDIDPVENFKEFHRRFFSVEFGGVWMTDLK